MRKSIAAVFAAASFLFPAGPCAALAVVSTSPASNATNAARAGAITITFDRAVIPASVTGANLRAWGRSSGPIAYTPQWSAGNTVLTLVHATPFFPGERISLQLGSSIQAGDATTLRSAGYSFQFTTAAPPASMQFTLIDTVSVRTTAAITRLYGGAVADFNRDGWIDYVAINEVSADLRVLLNRADGSGRLQPVLLPPRAIGQEASPHQPADFDNDGLMDMATSNTSSNTVSVVLGNGDGTFDPQQSIPVGTTPHGIAALDVDGDADLDLVNANQSSNNLTLMRNNGSGVFGASTGFDSGGNGEYALAAGDMDNDGIMDLVAGTRNDMQVHVLHGNGDGTFAHVSNRSGLGYAWMIQLGDLNNDGKLDVSMANGQQNNGVVLLGNGNGTLQAATSYPFAGSMVGTDLGDMDGDGDLDWVVSSFGASRWYVLRNDGAGAFTQVGEFPAPSNGSCASIYDFDNDGDLDMALADETSDVILLYRNGAPVLFTNGFE
ncbi:MAG TPA: FG-GAP-like repeat-containing protein [Xanthomonadales bacterium]|nr:FG-GAP-like repeat-containing protein [Xanthomonadales bacterium]